MSKECRLYDKKCTNCGECNYCDLDPKKQCTSCCKCIDNEESRDYHVIEIEEIKV